MKTPFMTQVERAVLEDPPHAHPELRASQPTPTEHELARRIAAHPFGHGLSEEHLLLLARCASEIDFVEGQMIVREGDPANRFYLIFEGEVAIESAVRRDLREQIQTVGAGEVVGWSWFSPPYKWHFSVRTLRPTKAIFLYGTWIRELCEVDHELGFELARRELAIVTNRLEAARLRLAQDRAFGFGGHVCPLPDKSTPAVQALRRRWHWFE